MDIARRDFIGGLCLSAVQPFGSPAVQSQRSVARSLASRLADTSRGPFLIAHRGCQSLAPENTVPSFVCAGRLGLAAIETDVRLTADGALVCLHDASLKRMFALERNVADMRLQELKGLRAARGNGLSAWPQEALGVAMFSDYLDVCERYDAVPFVETKGDVAVVARVLEVLRRRSLMSVAVLSSISIDHVREARRLSGEIFVHHIFSKPELLDELAEMGNAGLSYNYPNPASVDAGLVRQVHLKGVKMCLRAGDTPEAVRRMVELGLDYIPTNVTVPLD